MAETPVTCPFCGIACDDLLLDEKGALNTRGCAKAAAGFARPVKAREARIAGRAASRDEATGAAAAILRQARLPLFTGLRVDGESARAVVALADQVGGIVDPWRSAAVSRNLAVVQRSGALNATFGEVANRADVIVLLGSDPARDYPRFFERFVDNRSSLYREERPWVAYIGPADGRPAGASVAEHLHADAADLVELISGLAAVIGGVPLRPTSISGVPMAAIVTLAQRLEEARYGVVVWDAAILDSGDLVVEKLLHIIRLLNRHTRCVGLPLGGNGNAQGVLQALLWQTGWPAQLCFAHGVPEHDPWLYNADRLLASGEVDTLVWIDTLGEAPPPLANIPTIALVPPDLTLSATPDVEIRVGIPGLDHAGTIVRADTVVSLPLTAVRASTLPSAASIVRKILDQLARVAP